MAPPPPPQLNIVIIGAGLGGLSAAISCLLSGHRVTVLEAAKELAEVGAGIQLSPNATRLLEAWGLGPALSACAVEPASLTIHRYTGTKVLSHDASFGARVRARHGAPYLCLHRVDLQRMLHARALALGARVLLGRRVASADPQAGTATTCAGEVFAGDLVVGADGLRSAARAALLGRDSPPRPTGDLAYRAVLQAADLREAGLAAKLGADGVALWLGPHAHAVAYPLRGGQLVNLVLVCPDDLPAGVARAASSGHELRRRFDGWDPALARMLARAGPVDKWRLLHHGELDRWTSAAAGAPATLALLGDACHPMLPYMAQGACSAIEDGAALGRVLARMPAAAHLPRRAGLYQTLRKARGEAIARHALAQRRANHLPDGPEQEARDRVFAGFVEGGPDEFPLRWKSEGVQAWLYAYDALAEAERAVEALG